MATQTLIVAAVVQPTTVAILSRTAGTTVAESTTVAAFGDATALWQATFTDVAAGDYLVECRDASDEVLSDGEVSLSLTTATFPVVDRLDLVGKVLGGGNAVLTGTGVRAVDAGGNAIAVEASVQTALTAIADLPTVSELEARTLPAADYFDPASDTVASVTAVGTVTTLTNLPTMPTDWLTAAGLSAAAVAKIEAAFLNEGDGTAIIDAIVQAIDAADIDTDILPGLIRDAILNRVLSGNHDTAGTLGKLLQDAAADVAGINGDAIPTPAAIATQVRAELATELAYIDGNISDVLQAGDYVVPPTPAEIEEELASLHGAGLWDAVGSGGGGGDATAANQATILAALTAIQGTGFVTGTDSLVAIRARGDVAWLTATGFSTLTQADIRSAVGLSAANLGIRLDDLPTVAEFEARTLAAADYFDPAADAVANVTTCGTVTLLAADALTAAALSAAAVAKIEAALLNEGDGSALIDAIVQAIDAADIDTDLLPGLVRDALLNRVLSGNHDTAGTVGKILQDVLANVGGLAGAAMRGTDGAYTGTPPSASVIAAQVRTELTAELARIDGNISDVLQATDYTPPLAQADIRTAIGLTAADLGSRLDDLPTVAEFEARTLPTANYFDPTNDTVANVTACGTVGLLATDALTAASLSTAAVAKIEGALLNDGDGAALLAAVVAAIDAADIDTDLLPGLVRDAILNRVLAGNHDTAGTVGKLLQETSGGVAGLAGFFDTDPVAIAVAVDDKLSDTHGPGPWDGATGDVASSVVAAVTPLLAATLATVLRESLPGLLEQVRQSLGATAGIPVLAVGTRVRVSDRSLAVFGNHGAVIRTDGPGAYQVRLDLSGNVLRLSSLQLTVLSQASPAVVAAAAFPPYARVRVIDPRHPAYNRYGTVISVSGETVSVSVNWAGSSSGSREFVCSPAQLSLV